MGYEKAICPVCNNESKDLFASGKDYEYNTVDDAFYIYRCKFCNHFYLNPKPDLKEFGTIYPDHYYSYDFVEKKGMARTVKAIIEKNIYSKTYKKYAGNGKIVDVGCGDGRLISILKRINDKWDVRGVEFNKGAIERARKRGIYIYEGVFEDVNIKDKDFDLIIMNELIEHVTDPNSIIKRSYGILKRGSYLIIETPCTDSPDFYIFKNKYWGGYHFPRHINIFSRKSIKEMLNKNGFNIVKIESLVSPPFWILSFHHYLLDKKFPDFITKWFNFYNPLLLTLFTFIDFINIKTNGITSTMRIIARKT